MSWRAAFWSRWPATCASRQSYLWLCPRDVQHGDGRVLERFGGTLVAVVPPAECRPSHRAAAAPPMKTQGVNPSSKNSTTKTSYDVLLYCTFGCETKNTA
ncbi:hypothetical protein DQ04_07421020 [Trypanosoma grayi]|uniref:hypothetical protein n=1 Tax=Trypanosoma grayi TaxID=71804 RepID=UPI0004F4A561|nr:hypothetical protein DQ04_07421020 [Trypanosoma grayi]KEG08340.1 hypothetical protein DQ04_07421020 [Trypanosoma grayi]